MLSKQKFFTPTNNSFSTWIQSHRFGLYYGLSVIGFYGLLLWIQSPKAEFPLNDDWAYAQSVRVMLTTGKLQISEWAAATTVFQIYYGTLFAKFSGDLFFTGLRLSTLSFSLISCLALYDLLRQLEIPPASAWLGCLILMVNPIFIYLSYTFMTDIFYLGAMLLALAFYGRGWKRNNLLFLFIGSLFAGGAYLSRQLGLTLPAGIILLLLLKKGRSGWREVLAAGFVPAGIIIGHTLWLQYIHGQPWGFELNAVQNSLKTLLQPLFPLLLVTKLFNALLYLGMFSLPIFLGQLFTTHQWLTKWYGVWLMALAVFTLYMVGVLGQWMPYLANVINQEGLGPLTLAGLKNGNMPFWLFGLVTLLAPFAGAAQGSLWTEMLLNQREERPRPGSPLLLASLFMAGFTSLIVILWDEYLLVFVPAGLYLLLRTKPLTPMGQRIAILACIPILAYSLLELKDHFAWHNAQWQAGQYLVNQGIQPEQIDGGLEWVGWYEFEATLPQAITADLGNDLFGWTTINPKEYILAFEPLSGHRLIHTIPYQSPFASPGLIYILQSQP